MTSDPLASIRSILLSPEQARLAELEAALASAQRQAADRLTALQTELAAARQAGDVAAHRLALIEAEAAALRRQIDDVGALLDRLRPEISALLRQAIRASRDDMAEALGPVMGEAIRVQIRDSRQEMVAALYPIIGETVQRAITEFGRELQRNIDAQLRTTFGPEGALRALNARLRGVSPAQLALRNALPFQVQELFLIQRESGLLLAHLARPGAEGGADSDLVSGMLTAIRDFVNDAFQRQGEAEVIELEEIQYGDERIMVESGSTAYVAAVITGVEPQGFRATLRQFITDLHVREARALRAYTGDPATLPPLAPRLTALAAALSGAAVAPRTLSRQQRLAAGGLALATVLCLTLACFYGVFTYNLLPMAFPPPTRTDAMHGVSTPTATPTATALPPTGTPTATPLPPTGTSTVTPLPPTRTDAMRGVSTPTVTPVPPTATPEVFVATTRGNVWVRVAPQFDAAPVAALTADTPVTLRAATGEWIEILWETPTGAQTGWVYSAWLTLTAPVPPALITPNPGP